MRIRLWFLIFLVCAVGLGVAVPRIAAQEARYRVAGRVVNAISGAVVERVQVTLADARVPTRKVEVMTGEGGEFAFMNVPAGKFTLSGVRAGYQVTGYEQHEEFSTAIVTEPGMETGDLVLRLMPLSMIAGYVLDENGEGVRKARVSLYREVSSGGATEVSMEQAEWSDDRGYFDFNLLKSGKYFVSVDGKPWYAVHPPLLTETRNRQGGQKVPAALDVVYPLTFYGGETDEDSAQAIYLRAGDRQEISIRLTPVPSLHLLMYPVTNARGQSVEMPVVQKRVFGGMVESYVEVHPAQRGSAEELTGLAAGRYDVTLPLGRGGQSLGEENLEQNGQVLNSSRGEPNGRLRLTLKTRGGEPLPERYDVELLDPRMKTVNGRGESDGTAVFDELKPGRYGIQMSSPGRKYSVVRTISAAGELTGNHVNVGAGTTEVTAEVVEGMSEVDGVVQRDGKPQAGTMVVLVPKEEGHPELYRREQSALDGSFVIQGVVPGSYSIVALDDWNVEWKEMGKYAGKSVLVREKVMEVGVVSSQ